MIHFIDRKIGESFSVDLGGESWVFGVKIGFFEFRRADNQFVIGISAWTKTK